MTAPDPTLTYVQYLGLEQLLTAQRPRSGEHDETLFIIMHQVYELWFKQILHELGRLQACLESGDTPHVQRTAHRTLAIFRIMIAQLDVLETMTPTQFSSFRDWLAASSGFESAQFREIEAVFGRRDRRVAERYPEGSAERARISGAMSRRSLFDSFVWYLREAGYAIPAAVAHRDVRQPLEPSAGLQEILRKVYQDDAAAVVICELLVDLDEDIQEWRYRHVKMVERTIGGKRGTAGSSGAAYLRSTTGKPAFPDLWTVRTYL
jgi:tryptophan 2,3-dioxygenase